LFCSAATRRRIDFVVLATLLFPDLLFNFAFLRVMRLWAIGRSRGNRNACSQRHQTVVRDTIRARFAGTAALSTSLSAASIVQQLDISFPRSRR
jgi:hypothetical protein